MALRITLSLFLVVLGAAVVAAGFFYAGVLGLPILGGAVLVWVGATKIDVDKPAEAEPVSGELQP